MRLLAFSLLLMSISSFKTSLKAKWKEIALSGRKNSETIYTGSLKKGIVSPSLDVPFHIERPSYHLTGKPKKTYDLFPWMIPHRSKATVEKIKVACKLAREVLDAAVLSVKPGMTTDDIDKLVHEETIKRNAYPSPLNYQDFPKSVCTSVNEVICHGIPDSTVLKSGDIVNIDVTVYYDGVHGDCSETVLVGNVADSIKDLVKTTFDALMEAIKICKPGVHYNKIGGVVEDIIIPKGYSSVREFCGHGIGENFHDLPNVYHYRNSDRSGVMKEGHTFTIEPMICLGKADINHWNDGWTVTTIDGKPSAQFEHTLLITSTGVDILTKKFETSPKYFWER